jgi:NADPH-ferrihemoprotein reductase
VLQGVTYGVFGLGNKQYEHFAAVGKRMHKALAALGAQPLCDRGDGDDDDDIDADFDAWQAALLEGLDASPLVAVPKVIGHTHSHSFSYSRHSSPCEYWR